MHKDNLEKVFNLTVMFLTAGGRRSTRNKPTRREGANSMQKDLRLGFEPRTSLLQDNSAATSTTSIMITRSSSSGSTIVCSSCTFQPLNANFGVFDKKKHVIVAGIIEHIS